MFYTGKSPLEASLVQGDIENNLICPLSVNLLMTSHGQKHRPLRDFLTTPHNTLNALFFTGIQPRKMYKIQNLCYSVSSGPDQSMSKQYEKKTTTIKLHRILTEAAHALYSTVLPLKL